MKIKYMVQQSPSWWEARCGIPTASGFDRIFTNKTAKPSSSQDDYIAELIADRLCQNPNFFSGSGVQTRAMDNGISTEPEARRWYEMAHECEVQQVGFCLTEDERWGCSPDGLMPALSRGLELKCPIGKTHMLYLMKPERLLDDYRAQVHGSLIVTGYKEWDLCSYCMGLAPVKIRVVPDAYTEKLRAELENFDVKFRDALEKAKQQWAGKDGA